MCFMKQGIKFTEVWHIMWFFAGTLIWYHIHKHTVHSEGSRLTHPYKYILTPPVVCSQQLSVLHWLNNSLISKIYLLIRCKKTKFFQTLKKDNTGNSSCKNKWYPLFLKHPPILPTPPFLWEKYESHLFAKISQTHPTRFIKGSFKYVYV